MTHGEVVIAGSIGLNAGQPRTKVEVADVPVEAALPDGAGLVTAHEPIR